MTHAVKRSLNKRQRLEADHVGAFLLPTGRDRPAISSPATGLLKHLCPHLLREAEGESVHVAAGQADDDPLVEDVVAEDLSGDLVAQPPRRRVHAYVEAADEFVPLCRAVPEEALGQPGKLFGREQGSTASRFQREL